MPTSPEYVAKLLADTLRAEAAQLDRWANESAAGGWSTHQVQPMRERANEIWALLGRLGL